MVNIKWCLKIKNGIELIEPNENMSESYLKMAEESFKIIRKVEKDSQIWLASISYYSIYYALYSVMMKIGVKCEIHSCTIEFMRKFLMDFYDKEDFKLIENAFEIRHDVQYYPNRLLDIKKLNVIVNNVSNFLIKTKEIISGFTERNIEEIRGNLK